MRAALASSLALALAACGGGTLPDGGGTLQGPPVLAPLGTGARWTYRVTDPVTGVFQKQVEVLGPENVPQTTTTAILVRDVEPTNEERAWLEVKDGFLVRQREEDWKTGLLVRATSWSPPAPKTLAVVAEAGYSTQLTVTEHEWHPDGSVTTKDQIYAFTVIATGVAVTAPAGHLHLRGGRAAARGQAHRSEAHLLARPGRGQGPRGGRADRGARRVRARGLRPEGPPRGRPPLTAAGAASRAGDPAASPARRCSRTPPSRRRRGAWPRRTGRGPGSASGSRRTRASGASRTAASASSRPGRCCRR